MTLAEIVTAALAIASVLLLVVQVHIAAKTLRDDHLRRRQQATLEYLVRDVRPHWRDDLRTASTKLQAMASSVQADLKPDQAGNSPVAKLLGSVEHMSVGVNIGVYDLEVLDRSSGRFLIRIFRQFLPYIRSVQAKTPTAYVEFERVIGDLCGRRGIPVPTLAGPHLPPQTPESAV